MPKKKKSKKKKSYKIHLWTGVDEIRAKYTDKLLKLENVVGVATGFKEKDGKRTDEIAVIVYVEKKNPLSCLKNKDVVPSILEDTKTDVIESGKFHALQSPGFVNGSNSPQQSRRDKWRPALGGVSIGHVDITAGTLGCLVTRYGETFILSNNHVLANSNNAVLDDPILQPGPYDGGTEPNETIALLEDFIPIGFLGGDGDGCPISNVVAGICNWLAWVFRSAVRLKPYRLSTRQITNKVDCAIAEPLEENYVENTVLDIGVPKGSELAVLGDEVKKSGRTTELSKGLITAVNATVTVGYGNAGTAIFVDQLVTTNMSQGGDSGSVLFNEEDEVVGLLFAGSSAQTIHNKIENVLDSLNIQIKTN